MKVHELEQMIVQRLHAYPAKDPGLGQIARVLGVTQPFLRQLGAGERPIPRRLLDALAEQVGLAYDVGVVDTATGEPLRFLSSSEAPSASGNSLI